MFSIFFWQCFAWPCFDTARVSDNSWFLRLAYLWVSFVKTRFPFFLMKTTLWGHMACSWRSVTHKIDFYHFFFVALSGGFYKNLFFHFLLKKAFWWRVACHVRSIGEKHDLGPAEHTVAARGLFDFTVPWWIHIFVFFCHDSCGRNTGFCDNTPFLSVFFWAQQISP